MCVSVSVCVSKFTSLRFREQLNLKIPFVLSKYSQVFKKEKVRTELKMNLC